MTAGNEPRSQYAVLIWTTRAPKPPELSLPIIVNQSAACGTVGIATTLSILHEAVYLRGLSNVISLRPY